MTGIGPLVLFALCAALHAQSPVRYRELPQLLPRWSFGSGTGERGVAGDFDGDGNVDLLGRGAIVARGDGNGTFGPAVLFGALPAGASFGAAVQMAAADFDQDGRTDIAAVVGNDVRLYLTTATGLQNVQLPLPPGGGCLAMRVSPVAGDVDGDGRVDLLVVRQRCVQLTFGQPEAPILLRNLGGGTFAPLTLPNVLLDATFAWIADCDGDGDRDLVFLQLPASSPQPAGRVIVLRQDPGMQFTAVTALAQGTLAGSALETADLGDVDGDGLPDIVVVGNSPQGSEVLRNTGGAFTRTGTGPVARTDGTHLRLADLDRDGRAEAVLLQTSYQFEVWGLGTGGSMQLRSAHGLTLTGESDLTDPPRPLLADLDNDQDFDLVLFHASLPVIWFGDSRGGFTAAATGPSLQLPSGVFADIDGDGFVDQIGISRAGLALARNDGSGRMVPLHASLPDLDIQAASQAYAQAFDFDGDGDQDLLVCDGMAGNVANSIVRNDGSGNYSIAQRWPGSGDIVRAIVTDVDRDSDQDVILVRRSTSNPPLELLRNNGPGNWQRLVLAQVNSVFDVQPCNADGDGAVDLLVIGLFDQVTMTGSSRVLQNNGNGVFAAMPGFPPLAAWTGAAGDFDLDGDDDFVLDGTVVWNHGFAFTTAPLSTTPPASEFRVWGIADVDRNVVPDIVVSHQTTLQVWRRQATGAFAISEQQPLLDLGWPQFPGMMRMADLDRDGDLDLLTPAKFFFDTGHQLTRRSLSRLGRPSTKTIMAPPGTLAVIAASFGRTAIPTPFGISFLDPASTFVLGFALVPTTGDIDFGMAVPNLAHLEGIELLWQAATLDGPFLTGPEPSRLGPR